MRNPNKINWNAETWQQYIDEAIETAKNLKTLGALEASERWEGLAIERDKEFKSFTKPKIPYQE